MQSFMAPSLATKAAAKAQIDLDIDPDSEEILDLLQEIATDPKK